MVVVGKLVVLHLETVELPSRVEKRRGVRSVSIAPADLIAQSTQSYLQRYSSLGDEGTSTRTNFGSQRRRFRIIYINIDLWHCHIHGKNSTEIDFLRTKVVGVVKGILISNPIRWISMFLLQRGARNGSADLLFIHSNPRTKRGADSSDSWPPDAASPKSSAGVAKNSSTPTRLVLAGGAIIDSYYESSRTPLSCDSCAISCDADFRKAAERKKYN